MVEPKKNMRDSVFVNIFGDKKYLAELYLSLHPEDTISEDDLEIITIENVLTNDMYNDLGFLVRNKLIVLVEAQTTWSKNIIMRMFLYLARTYQDLIQKDKSLRLSLYKSQKMSLPSPELYVIYTGERGNKKDELSLKEEMFPDSETIDLKTRVIFSDENRKDIIGQYIAFCGILKEQIRQHQDDTKTAIQNAIRICIETNILGEYLGQHKKEVEECMFAAISQEDLIRDMVDNARDEGKIEATIKTLRKFGITGDALVENLVTDFDLTKHEAQEKIQMYTENHHVSV